MYDGPDETPGRLLEQSLPNWTEVAVRAALRQHAPELARLPLELSAPLGAPLGIFCRGTGRLGPELMLKATWSEEAAERLLTQARVIRALDPLPLPLQRPILVAEHPLLVVYRRLPGLPLSSDRAANLAPSQRRRVASLLCEVLEMLHSEQALSLVLASGADLPRASFWSQSHPERLARDLLPMLDKDRRVQLDPVIRWIESTLSIRPEAAGFVHGDFHGWNLLFDEDLEHLVGVLDFESASLGDVEFDFRYLPGMGLTDDLFEAVEALYQPPIDRDRALAWFLLMDLGDALWRTEQSAPVEFGPIERRVDEALERVRRLRASGWS